MITLYIILGIMLYFFIGGVIVKLMFGDRLDMEEDLSHLFSFTFWPAILITVFPYKLAMKIMSCDLFKIKITFKED